MRKILSAVLCLIIAASLLPSLGGCTHAMIAEDLMADVKPNTAAEPVIPPTYGPPTKRNSEEVAAIADFTTALLRQSITGTENALVSPLSVLSALGMTANGAAGETRAQMESAFGMPVEQLNAYLHALKESPNTRGNDNTLKLANSIWLKNSDSLLVNPAFLQANADWYGAGAFRAPFDGTTRDDINAWVNEHTDGMIPRIIEDIPSAAVMYLVNALAFDARWADPYEDEEVRDDPFTTQNGEVRQARMMYSTEHAYLEDENTRGFKKDYEGSSYTFIALLPAESERMEDYLASFTGEKLTQLLEGSRPAVVGASLPQFESDYSAELCGALAAMGMPDAFDLDRADFTGIGSSETGNLFIGQVLHKTHIEADATGTKAAAATAIGMASAAAGAESVQVEYQTVHLDRPFVYLIVDRNSNLPLFTGVVVDVGR